MFYYFEKAVFFIIQHHKDWNYKIFFCILIDSRPNEFQKKKHQKVIAMNGFKVTGE
jgi:hypothetical protein